jgi:hypothetical protein
MSKPRGGESVDIFRKAIVDATLIQPCQVPVFKLISPGFHKDMIEYDFMVREKIRFIPEAERLKVRDERRDIEDFLKNVKLSSPRFRAFVDFVDLKVAECMASERDSLSSSEQIKLINEAIKEKLQKEDNYKEEYNKVSELYERLRKAYAVWDLRDELKGSIIHDWDSGKITIPGYDEEETRKKLRGEGALTVEVKFLQNMKNKAVNKESKKSFPIKKIRGKSLENDYDDGGGDYLDRMTWDPTADESPDNPFF